ncbi:unnamed protein product [Mytilus edulis]|uniref:Uncharacterized protein n=1 Tax=Mytilus edulis TaxID=6550 RepID=A0A8S3S431_MYTED|nr:unnamed protein product [Mytilus edulis]
MRDKEGFYSVEVLHWVLKVKGYEMHKLNGAAIKPLTTTETGNNLIGHLMSEFRMAVLIIRPRTSQHWISGIREDETRKINATLIRHFTSTEMAAKDIPENERQYFYTHMGHSEEMNKQTYQAPLAVMEIVKVGKHLKDIDNGEQNNQLPPIHFDEELFWIVKSTSSRSNSPMLRSTTVICRASREKASKEVHVDQVTDVTDANEQTEEGTRTTNLCTHPPQHYSPQMVDSVDISSHASTATLHSAPFKECVTILIRDPWTVKR